MAVIEFGGEIRGRGVLQDLGEALRAGWQAYRGRREERRGLAQLARLGPELIRDAGLDPDQVRDALRGGGHDLDAVGFRILLPRDSHLRAWRAR